MELVACFLARGGSSPVNSLYSFFNAKRVATALSISAYQQNQHINTWLSIEKEIHLQHTFSALAVFKILTASPCKANLSRSSDTEGEDSFIALGGGVELVACFLAGCSGSTGPSALFFCKI